MSKSKPFVIYQMFWLGTKWKKWTEYATREEAKAALDRLNSSPSAQYYNYALREPAVDRETAEYKGVE